LSLLYLIRHGQAGTRGNYDALSDLGRRQSRLVGEYLAGQKIRLRAFIAGCRNRQQQTAREVWRAYRDAGAEVPDIISDPQWNEFDLTAVFEEFPPRLCEADARFKQEYEELLRKLEDENSPVHHAWTGCDTQVMRAWIEGRFPCRTESWAAFRERILSRRAELEAYAASDTVAIVTSATPIAIWVAASLGVSDGHIMRLAGVLLNSALSTMRLRADGPMLFSFNGTPHLPEPQLRTFR